MSGIRLRAARHADVRSIESVMAAAFGAFMDRTGVRPAPLLLDWPTVISATAATVAVRDERIVGVLVLWPHPDAVLVDTVAVDPGAQGSGIGSLLLDRAELTAIEAGTNAVRLYTNAAMTEALSFYPRRGYTVTGRRREQGFDRVFFEKRLG